MFWQIPLVRVGFAAPMDVVEAEQSAAVEEVRRDLAQRSAVNTSGVPEARMAAEIAVLQGALMEVDRRTAELKGSEEAVRRAMRKLEGQKSRSDSSVAAMSEEAVRKAKDEVVARTLVMKRAQQGLIEIAEEQREAGEVAARWSADIAAAQEVVKLTAERWSKEIMEEKNGVTVLAKQWHEAIATKG